MCIRDRVGATRPKSASACSNHLSCDCAASLRKGKNVNIVSCRYAKFGDLLNELTGRLPESALPSYGVRQIYTPTTGRRIRDVTQLRDGASYVCAGFETFKPMNYGQSSVTAFVGECRVQGYN